jgi:hypothetical protein
MDRVDLRSNQLFGLLVENSIFTERQVSIILNRMYGSGRPPSLTSGAYFRQVGQCREKVSGVLYGAVLLQSTGVLEERGLSTLDQASEQMRVILSSDPRDISRDILAPDRMESVMSVISQLIKRVSRL